MKIKTITFFAILLFALIISNRLYGQGCGFNQSATQHGFNGETFGVKLGDVDNDGDLDAVTVDAYDAVEVWFNDGNGNFVDSAFYPSSNDFYGVELEDVDNDGDLDIIAIAFGWSSDTEIFLNDGNGNFTSTYTLNTDDTEESKLADLDGDGYVDLFHTGSSPEIWINSGSGSFTSAGTISIMGGDMSDVVLEDFDGDGDIDAFMSNDNGSNEIWFNNGNGNFTYGNSYGQGSNSFTGVAAGDFDNDGDMDVVFSGQSQSAEVWINDGNGSFSFGSSLSSSNYDKSVVVDDFDQDGHADIIISSYGSNGLEVWRNSGNANFSLDYQNSGSVYGHDLDVGDLNGDGFSDIYVGNFSGNNGDVVFFQGVPSVIKNYQFVSCDGSSVTVNGITYDSTGAYTQQFACDSLLYLDINIITIDTSTLINGCVISAVDSTKNYQWLNCSDNYTPITGATSRSYTPTSAGSYAVIVSDSICSDTSSCRFVDYNPQGIDYQFAICGGDSINVNGQTYDSSGAYTQNYGCDSIVNIDVTVIDPDTSVVKNGLTLEAAASGLDYQWVDCDNNYSPVPGETNQSFSPSADGFYAVIVTDSFCSDTSSCYRIEGTGISTRAFYNVRIYPNPANSSVTIEADDWKQNTVIRLLDLRGKLIRRKEITDPVIKMDVNDLEQGVYMLEISNERIQIIRKIVIQ
ncbi:MAG: FG-GAP-like repeat-containing protein [Bacteroidales bacterium]